MRGVLSQCRCGTLTCGGYSMTCGSCVLPNWHSPFSAMFCKRHSQSSGRDMLGLARHTKGLDNFSMYSSKYMAVIHFISYFRCCIGVVTTNNRVPSGTWKPGKHGDLNIFCPGLEIAGNLSNFLINNNVPDDLVTKNAQTKNAV